MVHPFLSIRNDEVGAVAVLVVHLFTTSPFLLLSLLCLVEANVIVLSISGASGLFHVYIRGFTVVLMAILYCSV